MYVCVWIKGRVEEADVCGSREEEGGRVWLHSIELVLEGEGGPWDR